MIGIKKWVKVTVWIFRKWHVFRPKNPKINFTKSLHEIIPYFYVTTGTQIEVKDNVFQFLKHVQRTPLCTFLGAKLTCFMFFGFIALFFLEVLVLHVK